MVKLFEADSGVFAEYLPAVSETVAASVISTIRVQYNRSTQDAFPRSPDFGDL